MTDLQRAVAEALNAQGALAKAHPGFTPREGQDHMAQAIARTLKSGGQLVVEAGTGVGKTYAYLVPVLLSGQRTMISTATKALQDQLALRDIPRLQQALGVQARVSVLKGRSSYLCLYRLATARQHPLAETPGNQFELSRIERWATATLSGDLAEMPDLADQSPIEPLVTSTRDNCLGGTCPQAGACFVNRARATAMASDIVVVNHHLFFADMNVRESGVAELLPNTDVVVFDEAHQLNDIGVQFLGRQLSTRQLEDLTHDLCLQSSLLALGSAQWSAWVAGVSQMTATLRAWGGRMGGQSTVPWDGAVPSGFPESDWHAVTECLRSDLSQLSQLLEHLAESSPDLNQLAVRVDRCLQELTFFTAPVMEDQIRWLECGPHLKMQCSPLSISMGLQSHMDPGENLEAAKKTWVFTSATLGTDPELAMFRNACGLQTAQVLRVDSPFDYASQAALYIPENFPLPADPLHSIEVAHLVAHAARILGGRTLVLTTSLRAMRTIGEALRMHFSVTSSLDVLVQDEFSKREILERFGAGGVGDRPGLVVVAAASFWEGVDIPGDALQLVVIDKIPFAPPDGPLTKARAEQVEALGKNAFREHHLPHAALGLKQGSGRLIRSEHDRGLLVVCDVRLNQKAYGKKLLAALPPMRRLSDRAQFDAELAQLTKLSTTDLYWS